MLKGYYGNFAQWCQKYTAYCQFKVDEGNSFLKVDAEHPNQICTDRILPSEDSEHMFCGAFEADQN